MTAAAGPPWPPPAPAAQPWSDARIRPRHGELGPIRRGRCSDCNRTTALAEITSITAIRDGGRQWELGHCKAHLTAAERDFVEMVAAVTRFEDGVIIASGRGVLAEMDRLDEAEWRRQQPDRPPVPGLPACWQWMRDSVEAQALGSAIIPRASTVTEMEEWQAGRCAICGEIGAPDLDHDHWSGLIRGFLCKHCNGADPASGPGLFWPVASGPWTRYQLLNPARWLHLRIPYTTAQHQQRWGKER